MQEEPLCVEMVRRSWCEAMSYVWINPEAVPTRRREEVCERVRVVISCLHGPSASLLSSSKIDNRGRGEGGSVGERDTPNVNNPPLSFLIFVR